MVEFRIKEIREEKNMSQEDLAKKSKVSRTIISGLEFGTLENTTIDTLTKIAKALDTKIEDIFFTQKV